MEIIWENLTDASKRAILMSVILLALGDQYILPNHAAIIEAGDVAGTNSDEITIREDNLNGATLLRTIAENGAWSNSGYDVTQYQVGIAHKYDQFTISDLANMLNDGQLDPERFFRHFAKSEALTWTDLLCGLFPSFVAQTDLAAAPDIDDLYGAIDAVDVSGVASGIPKIAVLHPTQVSQLRLDAAFDQQNNQAVWDEEAKAIAKAMEGVYVGRYNNTDIFKSNRVQTIGGKYVGGIFARGAIAKAWGTPKPDPALARSTVIGRLRLSAERDGTGPRSALRCDTFMGVAIWQNGAGRRLKSPAS